MVNAGERAPWGDTRRAMISASFPCDSSHSTSAERSSSSATSTRPSGAPESTAIGLLVAVRARSIEAVSGLMNVVQLPMWLLSGTFFSSERFPAVIQPLVQALPLTLVNNSLRAIMNESAGLATVAPAAALLAAWGLASFFAALKWFRWD